METGADLRNIFISKRIIFDAENGVIIIAQLSALRLALFHDFSIYYQCGTQRVQTYVLYVSARWLYPHVSANCCSIEHVTQHSGLPTNTSQ